MIDVHKEAKVIAVKVMEENDWTIFETVAIIEIAKQMILLGNTIHLVSEEYSLPKKK